MQLALPRTGHMCDSDVNGNGEHFKDCAPCGPRMEADVW